MDSTQEIQRIAASANKVIKPPKHVPLSEDEIKYFDEIISELAKAEWTDHKITLAAFMAKTMNLMHAQQEILDGVVGAGASFLEAPPAQKIIKACYDQIIAMRRSLSIHAGASGLNKKDIAKRNQLAKSIENAAAPSDDDDDLIRRPLH